VKEGHDLFALLHKPRDELVDICSDIGCKKDERSKLLELVAEVHKAEAKAPSVGGRIAAKLSCREVKNYEGSGLTVKYLPFSSQVRSTYQFFIKSIGQNHASGLEVLTANIPQECVDENVVKQLIFLVVGATGAGKSTQIDAMLNYLLGVKPDEGIRFKCVDETLTVRKEAQNVGQAMSQTDDVTVYTIPPIKNGPVSAWVKIVDTPGFGDTRGLEYDRKIVDQLTKLFRDDPQVKEHVPHLNAVLFVTPASAARLTEAQEFVWTSILGVFGRDVGQNVLMQFTFADGKEPLALKAVKASDIPFHGHFKFNNSALFANLDSDDEVSRLFWEMGTTSMARFFAKALTMQSTSLDKTQAVLSEREKLENSLERLPPLIKEALSAAETLRQEEQMMRTLDDTMTGSKDFTYEVTVTKFKKHPVASGINTTTCTQCDNTCHEGCAYENDDEKKKCYVMEDENCTVCPRKCHWSKHQNLPYTLEYYEEKQTKTAEDLKTRYYDAANQKSQKQQIVDGLTQDRDFKQKQSMDLISRMKMCQERLAQIALRPNVMPSEQYLQMMIENEQRGQKPGYCARIKALEDLKQRSELVKKIQNKDYDFMAEYKSGPQIAVGQPTASRVHSRRAGKAQRWPWSGLFS